MSNLPKLSVIIPVYNTQLYLRKTLDSVLSQTYKNLEIICVNDGSTDNSYEILDEYKNLDERIIVINQENKGLSIARNVGMKYATGSLFSFLDSDDWVDPLFYEKLVFRLLSDDSDIAVGETFYAYPDRLTKNEWVNYWNFKGNLNTVVCPQDKQNLIYACACWNKVYKRKFIDDYKIFFPENLHIEDVPFTFKTIVLSSKISLVREAIIYYRQQDNSIMKQSRNNMVPLDIFKIYNICDEFLSNNIFNIQDKQIYYLILDNFKIFNIYSWFNTVNIKYKEMFYSEMKSVFSKTNIKNNSFITEESKKIYHKVLSSRSFLELTSTKEKKGLSKLLYIIKNICRGYF